VDYSRLEPDEVGIHRAHNQAVADMHFTYDDPATGLKVVTRLRHFLKGNCCGNACRHCIYEHEAVVPEVRQRREFNSAFWRDRPGLNEDSDEDNNSSEWSVSQEDIAHFLEVVVSLVKECGQIIETAISSQNNTEISEKDFNRAEGNASAILTETDLKVEKHLIAGLRSKFPDHQFIGEESEKSSEELGNAPTWIIDPIDGTMNFVHSNPLVCTSIGLTVNKKLVLGVVNCPLIGKLYRAVRGQGAFCNNTQIRVSGVKDLGKAMMIMELPVGANQQKKEIALANLNHILDNAHSVRAPGPAAMDIAWIGAGAADGFFHQGIHSWDMAAGALIVDEAGGTLLSTSGGEFDLMSRGLIAASSRELALQIAAFIKVYSTPRDQDTVCHALA